MPRRCPSTGGVASCPWFRHGRGKGFHCVEGAGLFVLVPEYKSVGLCERYCASDIYCFRQSKSARRAPLIIDPIYQNWSLTAYYTVSHRDHRDTATSNDFVTGTLASPTRERPLHYYH